MCVHTLHQVPETQPLPLPPRSWLCVRPRPIRTSPPKSSFAGSDTTATAAAEILALRQAQAKGISGGSASRADAAATALTTTLSELLKETLAAAAATGGDAAAAAAAAVGKAVLYKAAVARLTQWGGLKPLVLMQLPSTTEQVWGEGGGGADAVGGLWY